MKKHELFQKLFIIQEKFFDILRLILKLNLREM